MIKVTICRTCKNLGRVLNGWGECTDCSKAHNPLEEIKTDLLAWAGLHRGKAIGEEAMPRFHEIIDRLDAIIR